MGKNNNFTSEFKLETITTNHIGFVVKVLSKYCGHSTFFYVIYQPPLA